MDVKYIFDLDNTLVLTNQLNNAAYYYALQTVGFLPISDVERLTRRIIKERYQELSEQQYDYIVQLKQRYFREHINQVEPNHKIMQFLKSCDPADCVLWTCAEPLRAQQLIRYLNISSCFQRIFFVQEKSMDTLGDICRQVGWKVCDITVFEDDASVVENLKATGVQIYFCK